MNFFRRSRARDAVDRINNFWTGWFFLILAIIALCVPFQDQPVFKQEKGRFGDSTEAIIAVPEFTTRCWCPAQFEDSHVTYTNEACSMAVRDTFLKRNKTQQLYTLQNFPGFPPVGNVTEEKVVEPHETENEPDTKNNTGLPLTNHGKALFALFVFVILLKLPYIVADLVEKCLGLLNIDLTIQHAVDAQNNMNEGQRMHMSQEVAQCAMKNVRPSPYSLSIIFLFMKLLCCSVILFAIIRTQGIDVTTEFLVTSSNRPSNTPDYPFDQPYICSYHIRQMSNEHHYDVQCVFTLTSPPDDVRVEYIRASDAFATLAHIVLAYLVFLLVINVISLAGWIVRLAFTSCKPVSLALPPGTCLDLQLTFLLAHDNAGPLVAERLARAVATSQTGDSDLFKMHVNNDDILSAE